MKKIICLLTAAVVLSAFVLTASAASLSKDAGIQSFTVKSKTESTAISASDIGAEYIHLVDISTDGSRNVLDPEDGIFTANYDLDGSHSGNEKVKYGAHREYTSDESNLYNPYVAYKLSADDGKAIDTVKVNINYYLRKVANDCYYQIGIYVFKDFTPNADGSYPFENAEYAKLLTSTEDTDVNKINGAAEEIDLTSAVAALGESQNIYVVLLLNRGYFSAGDNTRLRINNLTIEATQKTATVTPVESDDSGESGNTSPTTSDAMIAVAAVAVVCGAVLVVAKKRK